MRRPAEASDKLRGDPVQADAKPFRREGLVRRVTPFISAGLVAMVVVADPAFARSPWADALTIAVAVAIAMAALAPIDWDRLPPFTMVPPILLALLLGLGPTFGQARAAAIAAVAVGGVVVTGIYGLPWDRLPRWLHNLPVFGGIGAVFVIQAAVDRSTRVDSALFLFPLLLTTVLFAALYHTRGELLGAATLAGVGILLRTITQGQLGNVASAILVTFVLWVVVLTINEVVRQSRTSEARIALLNDRLSLRVSDQTATNRRLAEQKRFVDSVLENLDELGVGLVAITGQKIDWANGAFTRLTGYAAGEGQTIPPVSNLIAPEYLDAYRQQFRARVAGERQLTLNEFEIIASDGRRIPVESIARAELIDGSPHGVALLLDITERKQIEHALVESRARLQAIVDTSLNAIVTMDEHGVITGWNPQAELTFGWRRDEAVGRVLAETIIPTRYRSAHRNGLAKFLKTGHGPVLGKILELSAVDHSGREFPVEIAISPASRSDGEALFVGFLRDITARKEAEAAIDRLNGELRKANRHKSEFLANMSHELRTPLNAILGFSELMIDDTSGRYDPATRLKYMEQIHSSGRHLLALINDILDLSKVEAGRTTLQLETVKVGSIVEQVVTTLQPLAEKKGIRLEADSASAGELSADGAKLTQMLLNLVSNGIKFTPSGGKVTIEAWRGEDAVEISVTDTGIGIAEADRARLFVAFEQLDSGAGRRQEGTGLGLALTRRLAQLHGGDVTAASEPGKGSKFTIRLPLKPLEKPSLPAIPAAGSAKPLILIVEDDPQAAHLLARQLDQGGFRTEIAVNATEAVNKAARLRPSAITLDILLPGVDGWHVLTQLKRDPETCDIPVVVISVVDEPELGRALGALDYLVKPVDGADLLRALDRHAFTSRVDGEEVRILIIDDEPANLTWLDSILKPAGFKVETASGGREGIEMVKQTRPHLVLLDLMMPDLNGFEVVEALQEEDATRSTPIMIITAKDLTDDEKRQLNGNVGAILSRGSTNAPDLLVWLQRLTNPRPVAS